MFSRKQALQFRIFTSSFSPHWCFFVFHLLRFSSDSFFFVSRHVSRYMETHHLSRGNAGLSFFPPSLFSLAFCVTESALRFPFSSFISFLFPCFPRCPRLAGNGNKPFDRPSIYPNLADAPLPTVFLQAALFQLRLWSCTADSSASCGSYRDVQVRSLIENPILFFSLL